MPTFPTDMPVGCPPDDSWFPDDVTVFRIVKANPPTALDFRTTAEEGKFRNHPDQCQRRGMSVYQDLADAQLILQLYPQLGRFIAAGSLTPHHGRIRLTAGRVASHTTWWPCKNISRENGFAVI